MVLDGPRGTLSQLTSFVTSFVPLAPLVEVLENRCFTTPHDGRWRRSRDRHGRLGPTHSDRVVGSRESDGSQNGAGLVAVASANLGGSGHCEWLDTCVSGRREETKGGTRRRMIRHFAGCVSNDPWGQCGRRGLNFLVLACSAARLLGGSAGSAGCQLTGPVAETPDVDLRRSASSHHQIELGGRCPGGADANLKISHTQVSAFESYSKKSKPRPGVLLS